MIDVLDQLRFSHVLPCLGSVSNSEPQNYVMEYFEMTLQDLIDLEKPLSAELVSALVLDITRGLLYLHSRGLCVKNLTLSSVAVVGNDMRAQLIVTPTTISEVTDGLDDIPALSRLIDTLVLKVPRPALSYSFTFYSLVDVHFKINTSKSTSSSRRISSKHWGCAMSTKLSSRSSMLIKTVSSTTKSSVLFSLTWVLSFVTAPR